MGGGDFGDCADVHQAIFQKYRHLSEAVLLDAAFGMRDSIWPADLDAALYTNKAQVVAQGPTGSLNRATIKVTIPAIQMPDLKVTKSTTVKNFDAVNME